MAWFLAKEMSVFALTKSGRNIITQISRLSSAKEIILFGCEYLEILVENEDEDLLEVYLSVVADGLRRVESRFERVVDAVPELIVRAIKCGLTNDDAMVTILDILSIIKARIPAGVEVSSMDCRNGLPV